MVNKKTFCTSTSTSL